MFKKYMSVFALSALMSSAVAEECCCKEMKPEVKAEVMEAMCAEAGCMKTEDENCCKVEETQQTKSAKGFKTQFKFSVNGEEKELAVYVLNGIEFVATANGKEDEAGMRIAITALDNDQVEIKAASLVFNEETNTRVVEEEQVKQVAIGTPANFVWENSNFPITVNEITVLELCDLNVFAEQAAQPEVASQEETTQAEEVVQAESEAQVEAEAVAAVEQVTEVETVATPVEQVQQEEVAQVEVAA